MEALFLKVVNMSLTASWMILAVLILRPILRKAPKWIPCMLWGFVALRLVCPFSIESALSLIPSSQPLPDNIIYTSKPQIQSGIPSLDRVVNPALSSYLPADPVRSVNPTQIFSFILSHIWMIVMVSMILYALGSYLRLKNRVSTATLFQDNIKQSEKIDSPFVLGFIRPTIYLPYHIEDADIHHVIAHEQAHIRRLDPLWKYIGFLLLSIYWFNPMMWISYHLLCRDIEVACDEKVVRNLADEERRAYSTALLHCSMERYQIKACPLAFGEVDVKTRIKNIMNYNKPSFWMVATVLLLCTVVAICLLTDPETKSDADASRINASVSENEESASIEFEASVPETDITKDTESENSNTASSTESPEIQIYWTQPIDDYTVSLQDGFAENTLEVHVKKNDSDLNVLTLDISYDYESPDEIMIDTFENILGHNGFRLYKHSSVPYSSSTYYFGMNAEPIHLATTWGEFQFPDSNDFSVDLDGDGCTELISSIIYTADGYTDTLIYHWNGESVETYYGTDVMMAAEPPFYIIAAPSTGSEYLPDKNKIKAWHWDSTLADLVVREYEIDLPALKKYVSERDMISHEGEMASEIYSEEMALDKLRTHLILAYEITYGEYIPSDEPLPDQYLHDREYLRRLIPKLYVKEETDQYYVIPVIWDFWVDKYTGEIFKFYNGIDPMVIPFDYSDPDALSFAG